MKIYEYICELRKKYEKLVLFVGSGVSTNVKGTPSWSELVSKMYIELYPGKEENKKFSTDELLSIPQYLYLKDEKKYFQIFENCFSSTKDKVSYFTKLFMDLFPQQIITTNYDKYIENDTSFDNSRYDVVYRDEQLLNSDKMHHVIKMHGDIENFETIVLKEKDYLDYSDNHKLIETYIKALMVDNTFLFCGYSISDYNVKMMINWFRNIQEKRHNFAYMLTTNFTEAQEQYMNSNGVTLINLNDCPEYEEVPEGIDHNIGRKLYSFLYFLVHKELDRKYFGEDQSAILHNELDKLDYIDIISILKHYNFLAGIDGSWLTFSNKEHYDLMCNYIEENLNLKNILLMNNIKYIEYLGVNYRSIKLEGDKILKNKYFSTGLYNQYKDLVTEYEKTKNLSDFSSIFEITGNDDFHMNNIYKGLSLNKKCKLDELVDLWNNVIFSYDHESQSIVRKDINNQVLVKPLMHMMDYFIDVYPYTLECEEVFRNIEDNLKFQKTNFIRDGHYNLFNKLKNKVLRFYYLNKFYGIHTYKGNLNKIYNTYLKAICCYSNHYLGKRKSSILSHTTNIEQYKLDIIDVDIITKKVSTKDFLACIQNYSVSKFLVEENVNIESLINNYLISKEECPNYIGHTDCLYNLIYITSLLGITLTDETVIGILKNFFNNQLYSDFVKVSNYYKVLSKINYSDINYFPYISILFKEKSFYEYLYNYGTYDIQNLMKKMCINTDFYSNVCDLIRDMINDSQIEKKYIFYLIIIFINIVKELDISKEILNYVKANSEEIPEKLENIFIYYGIISLEVDKVEKIVNKIHEYKEEDIKVYPNTLSICEKKLVEYAINDFIKDFSLFKKILGKSNYLDFLYDRKQFNWSKIDLLDRTWCTLLRKFVDEEEMNLHIEKLKEQIVSIIDREIKNKYVEYLYYKHIYK